MRVGEVATATFPGPGLDVMMGATRWVPAGGTHAAIGDPVSFPLSVFGAQLRGISRCRGGLRENSPGADVSGHDLHDVMQFAGGGMPIQLPHAGRGYDRQRHGEYLVSAWLLDATDRMSDHLRATLAVAMIR